MNRVNSIPVITIDGPTASGKGTIAQQLAEQLGWHTLDSGALYRLTALAIEQAGLTDSITESSATAIASALKIRFADAVVMLDDTDVTTAIRQENIGLLASKVAAWPGVRQALLAVQRNFRIAPGLVADGRDMGTVIFPDAQLKIFLDADVNVRAERRYKQLSDKGIFVKISDLLQDLQARDKRDTERSDAPLIAASDAVTIDSSLISIDEVVAKILALWQAYGAAQ